MTYLAQLGQLKLELVSAVLGVLQCLLKTLRTVVALDLFLKLAYAALMFIGLRPELMYDAVQELDLALLRAG